MSARSGTRMWRCTACGILISLVVATALTTRNAQALPGTSAQLSRQLLQIAECLESGNEAVLYPAGRPRGTFACLDRYERGHLGDDAAINVDLSVVCSDHSDPRILPGDAIKLLAAQQQHPIASSGIRISGAIFCQDELDLIGLDLPYALALDRAVFKYGIAGINFHTRGDFSINRSLVLQNLTLARAKIDGSVLARNSFSRILSVTDSEIRGSIDFGDSFILESVNVDRTTVTGNLSIRNTVFSSLGAQHSKIGGVLDLTYSQARCSYNLQKNEIGALIAVDAGFGATLPSTADSWWDGEPKNKVELWGRNNDVKILLTPAKQCGVKDQLYFYLFDNQVRTSLCLKSFHWPSPVGSAPPLTILALNGTIAAGNVIIDLWSAENSQYDKNTLEKRKFEAISVRADALIFNFGTGEEAYFTYVDGIKFDRVYSAKITCDYKPADPPRATKDSNTQQGGMDGVSAVSGELKSQIHLPNVTEVMKWLEKNKAPTTQPFTAFADAFQRVGAEAKELRAARDYNDLVLTTCRCLPMINRFWSMINRLPPPRSDLDAAVRARPCYWLSDGIAIALGWPLWALADSGYRPAHVVPWAALALIVSLLSFWFGLRTVAFKPEEKNEIRPIGLIFLFDWLIPLYKIREDNYKIDKFYLRVHQLPGGSFAPLGGTTQGATPQRFRFWLIPRQDIWGIEADDKHFKRAEAWLDGVKILGFVLTIFLAAAISTLVKQ